VRLFQVPDGLTIFEVSGKERAMLTKINLAEKLSRCTDQWSPKIVADLNDSHVKLVKVQGEFVWHQHPEEDELRHTGDVISERTVHEYDRI
jgi:hypothetical protein